ncbi:MAG: MBL fold metallo-hydrolase [Spirochaetales bacterium]|nr:MAG: MBL fold metallo-hydrolase [Spirochaetales bacterium]
MKNILLPLGILFSMIQPAFGQSAESDTFAAAGGNIVISFLGHGTLMLDIKGTVIRVDPVKQYADYKTLPKADIILITHEHGDHLDQQAVTDASKSGTTIILNKSSYDKLKQGTVMANGEKKTVLGIGIEAVPAYNITAGRENFHPKGRDNGYILTALGRRIYIAGDTENIPEMSGISNIDIAFLPMNQPYTMTPEQAAQAAGIIKPKVLYPYHFGNTDAAKLAELLKGQPGLEVRIRKLQ